MLPPKSFELMMMTAIMLMIMMMIIIILLMMIMEVLAGLEPMIQQKVMNDFRPKDTARANQMFMGFVKSVAHLVHI